MRERLACLFVLVLGAAPACGGGDDDTATGGDGGNSLIDAGEDAGETDAATGPAPTIDDLCNADDGLFLGYYHSLFECFPEVVIVFGEVPSDATLSAGCLGLVGQYIDDGTVTLGDAGAFATCRAYLADVDCDRVSLGDMGPCADVLVGHVAIDGDCDDDIQCAGDAYCTEPAQGETCGRCTSLGADGTECAEDSQCANGYCRPSDGAPSECAARGDIGDACSQAGDCLGRLRCDDTLHCAAPATWVEGSPCDSGDFLNQCGGVTSDLYCSPATNMCAQYREVGETCGFPDGDGLCRVFSYETCSQGTGECAAPQIVGEGDECGFFAGAKCDTGLRCVDHDGNPDTMDQCATPLGAGDECDEAASQCDLLLECVAGTCAYGSYTGMCPAG